MLTAHENERLTRVEGDAPMGALMRRHWIPALLLEQVAEPDGKPVRIQLLGERLVAFRDSEGRLGVLGEFCPHRKASLAFGRNEGSGLRCLYHGWKFDVAGNITDMPSEPKESGFCDRVKHVSYPVREWGGFAWVYMGDPAHMPEFEPPPWAPRADTQVSIVRMDLNCNWAQIMEGQIDSAHSSSLHSSDMKPAPSDSARADETGWTRPSTDKNPRIQVQVTSYGFRYAAIRRPIRNAASQDYVRITTFVAPFAALIPPNASYNIASVIVPKNDTSSYFHFIAWSPDGRAPSTEAWRRFCVAEPGVDLDADFRMVKRRPENDYLQDRALMREGNFTGIAGIPNQDIAMWESMGGIADRTSERLGASDIAVVQFRRVMLDAVDRHAATGEAVGLGEPHIPQAELASWQGIVPKGTNWRTLGIAATEAATLEAEQDETEREMAAAAAG